MENTTLKHYAVDFEHSSMAQCSFKGIYANCAENAIEFARKKLAAPKEWECVGVDRCEPSPFSG